MKRFVSAKIHNIRVQNKSVAYHGSVTIARDLLASAGIDPYEEVQIINLSNGNRWTTYAVPGDHGEFRLNGGGARLGEIGDLCVVLAYTVAARFPGASVIYCNHLNEIADSLRYEPEHANPLRVLELGNYIAVAYAGMLLAEQGAQVRKLVNGNDPILGLQDGNELWQWINHRKELRRVPVDEFIYRYQHDLDNPDIVIDNFRPSTLAKWHLDPAKLAKQWNCAWVSLRSEVGETSFDMLAQMRATAEYSGYVPFYLGDTSAGLWMSFKALSMLAAGQRGQHAVIGQASSLQKLVEGELVVPRARHNPNVPPWDENRPGTYYFDEETQEGVVNFKGHEHREPIRGIDWKRDHLWHDKGRIRI